MEIKKISKEVFKARSSNKGISVFTDDFKTEVLNLCKEHKGNFIQIPLSEVIAEYKGIANNKNKAIATFFITTLKQFGFKDSNKNRVSINRDNINLNLS